MKKKWALFGILLGLGPGLRGQAPEEEPPVFASALDIVAVDVNVVDGQGRPLRALAPGDFTLTVDGKSRSIVSLEYVDLAAEEQEETKAPPPSPYFSTNEGAPRGRLVLIVVDQGQIQQGGGRAVVNAADRLLDRLGPGDRTGLVTIPPPGPNVEFTADHAKVRDALVKVVGRGRFHSEHIGLAEAVAYVMHMDEYRWNAAVARECGQIQNPAEKESCVMQLEGEAQELAGRYRADSQGSIAALRGLFDAMKGIEGPKTLLLITEGLSDAAEGLATWRDLAARAAQARVSLYVLRLDTGSGMADPSRSRPAATDTDDAALRRGGVDSLAGLARGAVFNVVGSAETAYDRIARELTGYYLIGFEPEPSDRDGKDHSIRVQVDRKNVTIRARGSLTIPVAGSEPKDEARLGRLMSAPFPSTDLGLRVAAYSVSADKGRVRLLVSAEVERARGALTVGFALMDAKGKMAGSGARRLPAASGPGPVPFVGTTVVDPGVYTLKLAAIDAAGRSGTVDHPVKAVVLSAGGLELGDLVVGALPTQEEGFRPSVGLAVEGALVARVEMSGKDAARLQGATVAMEIAEAEDGPALVSVPTHTADAPEGGLRVAQAGLSLGVLPPGDYVVRAVVSVEGKPVGGLTRPLHLEPSASGTKQASLSIEGLAPSIGRFDLAEVLETDVLGHFLDRTARLVPGPASADVQAASDRARKGDAAGILDVLPAVGPEEVRFVFLRGIGLLAKGQVAPASTQFRNVLQLSSEFFPAAFYLGACYAASGEDRQAAGALQTALVTETGHPVVYRLLADSLLRVADSEEALRIAQEGATRWPDDDGFRRRVGLAYAMAGRRGEALTTLTGYVERHPQDAGAVFVTLRLLFDAFTADRAGSTPEERQRMVRYARSYVDARGPNQEIVARWLRYLEKEKTP